MVQINPFERDSRVTIVDPTVGRDSSSSFTSWAVAFADISSVAWPSKAIRNTPAKSSSWEDTVIVCTLWGEYNKAVWSWFIDVMPGTNPIAFHSTLYFVTGAPPSSSVCGNETWISVSDWGDRLSTRGGSGVVLGDKNSGTGKPGSTEYPWEL